MTRPKIGIIISTTRKTRFADRPAGWLLDLARERGDADYELVDLRDYPMPLYDEAASPRFAPIVDPGAQRFASKMASLDGFVFLTAEYNRSIPGALKNALDHVYHETQRKPAAFIGYGGVGAARAVEQLRLIAIEIGLAPMKSGVHINMEPFLAIWQQGKDFADFPYLRDGAVAMLDELAWWTRALRRARAEDAAAEDVAEKAA